MQAKNVVPSSAVSPFHLVFDLPIESATKTVFNTDFQATLEHRSPLLAIAPKTFEARLCNTIQQSFVDEVDTICGIMILSPSAAKRVYS